MLVFIFINKIENQQQANLLKMATAKFLTKDKSFSFVNFIIFVFNWSRQA